MKKNYASPVLLGLVLPLMFFLAGAASAHIGMENRIFILMTDDGFLPANSEITAGGTIYFKNISKADHWPASDEPNTPFDLLKKIGFGEEGGVTLQTPGPRKIYDKLNPQFKAVINVKENLNSAVIYKPSLFSRLTAYFKSTMLSVKDYLAKIYTLFYSAEKKKVADTSIKKNSPSIFFNDDALFSHVNKFGPAETLALSEAVPASYDRHRYAVKVGEYSYEIFKNSAFQWHDNAFSFESMNGYIFGVIRSYLKENGEEKLFENLKEIIGSDQKRAHVVGHGFIMWKDYELLGALQSCDLLKADEAITEACRGGVFMENIVGGRSPETGHYTNYLNNDPFYPCTILDPKYEAACYKYAPYRFIQLFQNDFGKFSENCLKLNPADKNSCFSIMGLAAMKLNKQDASKAKALCLSAPQGEDRNLCTFGAARASLWREEEQNNALKFCVLLNDVAVKDQCYSEVFNRAKDIFSFKDAYSAFCAKTEPQYRDKCLNFISRPVNAY